MLNKAMLIPEAWTTSISAQSYALIPEVRVNISTLPSSSHYYCLTMKRVWRVNESDRLIPDIDIVDNSCMQTWGTVTLLP